jgi:hypothetical protein
MKGNESFFFSPQQAPATSGSRSDVPSLYAYTARGHLVMQETGLNVSLIVSCYLQNNYYNNHHTVLWKTTGIL